MKVHYFQRYHQKENVATANLLLLLSRLYQYSQDKFFDLLRDERMVGNRVSDLGIMFSMQEKGQGSVPDGCIKQKSFKFVVETKLFDWFHKHQLDQHLNVFSNEDVKIFITIAPEYMDKDKRIEFEADLEEFNARVYEGKSPIIHLNTTFQAVIDCIRDLLDEKDSAMVDIVDDFEEFCVSDELIQGIDAWKTMRMQLAGTTIAFNKKWGVYYDDADRGFRPHDYLGLYTQKAVRIIGKITAIVCAEINDKGEIVYDQPEKGSKIVTEEMKDVIREAIEDSKKYGYNLARKHRYFFVDKFYDTCFRKSSHGPARNTRIFDLTNYIDLKKGSVINTEKIADSLRGKEWE